MKPGDKSSAIAYSVLEKGILQTGETIKAYQIEKVRPKMDIFKFGRNIQT
jgi:hypothetical protein